MAALTAASWTVTVEDRYIAGGRKYARGKMVLAGTDTYPTGGIPLPTKDKFGMIRQLDQLLIYGVDGGSTVQYSPVWDKTNAKLQLYVSHDTAGATTLPTDEAPTSAVPGARTYRFEAVGF